MRFFFLLSIVLWTQVFSQSIEFSHALPDTLPWPTFLTHAGDGSADIYILQWQGIIHKVDLNDPSVVHKFLDLSYKVNTSSDGGLLGMAFHPDFEENGKFYLSYTTGKEFTEAFRNRLSEFTVSPDNPDLADSSSERILLDLSHPYPFHNISHLEFGPDGYLYVGMGDGGIPLDSMGRWIDSTYGTNASNLDTLYGGILRIIPDDTSSGPYGIPPDNPLVGNSDGFREEIWASGLRNPWRFTIDPNTDILWVGDVGLNTFEEINQVLPGHYYGFPFREADSCLAECQIPYSSPFLAYGRDEGSVVIGGYVAVINEQPVYLFADYVRRTVWGYFTEEEEKRLLGEAPCRPTSFGKDSDGSLYITCFDKGIYQLTIDTSPIREPGPPGARSIFNASMRIFGEKLQVRLPHFEGELKAKLITPSGKTIIVKERNSQGSRNLSLEFEVATLTGLMIFPGFPGALRF